MKFKRVKLFAVAFLTLPLIALAFFTTKPIGTIVSADTDAAETYKAKCAICHSPKAEKYFDTAKKTRSLSKLSSRAKKAKSRPLCQSTRRKA